jgi:hypothetical protein
MKQNESENILENEKQIKTKRYSKKRKKKRITKFRYRKKITKNVRITKFISLKSE